VDQVESRQSKHYIDQDQGLFQSSPRVMRMTCSVEKRPLPVPTNAKNGFLFAVPFAEL
jgi:hypothetical protein